MYSIIVPCYNEEKNIKKLVKVFKELKEEINNLEIILVNNGSEDNTKEEIKKAIKEYPWIKAVNIKKNQGYGHGILTGLKVSSGEWKGWIHADLQISPKVFLNFIEIIESKNRNNYFFKGLRKKRPIIDTVFTIGMSVFESLYLKTILWDINAQPTLLHKNLFEKLIDPPLDFSFDLYTFYKAKKNNYKIVRIPVLQYDREEGNSSWNTGMSSRLKLIKRTIQFSKNLKKGTLSR